MDRGYLLLAAIYLLVLNFIGFLFMYTDKMRAQKNRWRIRESTLFLIAAAGGSVGSILGMKLFRHKTKHLSFQIGMPVILILQIVLGIVLYIVTA